MVLTTWIDTEKSATQSRKEIHKVSVNMVVICTLYLYWPEPSNTYLHDVMQSK